MILDRDEDVRRNGEGSPPRGALRALHDGTALARERSASFDGQVLVQSVDVATTEPEQLSATELAPCREQNDKPKPLGHRGGEGVNFGERGDRTPCRVFGAATDDLAR